MWDEYIKKYVAIILCCKKATIFLGSDVCVSGDLAFSLLIKQFIRLLLLGDFPQLQFGIFWETFLRQK